jgi:hypothetical protein
VHPFNLADLQRAGRLTRLAGALRLERESPPAPPAAPAVSLAPRRDGGRFVVLLPMTRGAPARRLGHLWALRAQHDETVVVPRPPGTRGAARVPATLLYELARPSGRLPLAVRLDGQVIRRASLLGVRGQVVLPPLAVGRHRLRVELPASGRLFLDQPVTAAPAFRRSQVYLLPGGATSVAVAKTRAPRALGLVMYIEGPPPRGRAPMLDVIVDGGRRRLSSSARRRASTAFTRLRRRQALVFQPVPGAVYLNRKAAPIWASRPIFVPLGDDLTPGTHQVSLHARGLGARPMARFFSHGGPPVNRINQHVEMNMDATPERAEPSSP